MYKKSHKIIKSSSSQQEKEKVTENLQINKVKERKETEKETRRTEEIYKTKKKQCT